MLKYRVWKIEFDELDFLSISNSNFAGYTGSKNLVQTRQKIQFIKLDFSNSIFQNPSADRYRVSDSIVKTNNAPSEITSMHCDTSIVDWTAMRKLEIISSLQLTASVWIWYKKNLSISDFQCGANSFFSPNKMPSSTVFISLFI